MTNLPQEIIKPVQKKEIFFTLAGILCLVLALNFLCVWYLKSFSRELERRLIAAKWEKLQSLEGPVDWLILGDSSGNQSFMPEVLNETLNASSVNLCTLGGLIFMNDLWMIQTYVEKFGPPKGVLLVHAVDIWYRDLNKDAMALVPLRWGFWNQWEPGVPLTLSEKWRIFLQKYVPIYSSHRSLTQKILSPRSTSEPLMRLGKDGFMSETVPNPEMAEEDKISMLDQIRERGSRISSTNLRALEELQQLAQEKNFEIYIIHGPLLDEVYQEKSFRLYFKKIKSEIKLALQSKNRLHLLLENPIVFPKTMMQSADHLIENGARVYSQKAVQELKKQIAVRS